MILSAAIAAPLTLAMFARIWPSDYVLSFIVRLLSRREVLETLDRVALNRFEASPRDLGGFYHRCYDLIREREIQTDSEELERLRKSPSGPDAAVDAAGGVDRRPR